MLLSIFSFSLALLNSSNRGSIRCLRHRVSNYPTWRDKQAYTYAILRFDSSEQRCSHCSSLSSPLVSLKTPKGLNRTATRPDPMAEHSLSTVSSVKRHLLVIDPPYSSLRWFTTTTFSSDRHCSEGEAYHYCDGTDQINTRFLHGSQSHHNLPISH